MIMRVDVDNQGGRWKKKKDGAKIQKMSIFKIRPCYSKLKVIYVFGYIKKNRSIQKFYDERTITYLMLNR